MSRCAISTPATEHKRHIGTTRITASGSDQLSYWAASTRNTSTTAKRKTIIAVLPVLELQEGQLGPFGLHHSRQGRLLRWFAARSIAVPELTPGAGVRLTAAAGYML